MTQNRIVAASVLAIMAIAGGTGNAHGLDWGGCFGHPVGSYGMSAACYGRTPACYGASASFQGVSSGCYGVSCYSTSNCSGWSAGCVASAGCNARCHGGPVRRLVAGIMARRATCACTGSCYGSSACYGSRACYGSGCYGCGGCYTIVPASCFVSCYGLQGTTGSSGYTMAGEGYDAGGSDFGPSSATIGYDTTPVTASVVAPPMIASTDYSIPGASNSDTVTSSTVVSLPDFVPSDRTRTAANTAWLSVVVAGDAEIHVNGRRTSTTGSHRRYKSSGLVEGKTYEFEVQACVNRDGKQQTETKVVSLTAGSGLTLNFDFPASGQSGPVTADIDTPPVQTPPLQTQLTLHLPARAKVSLEGTDTILTGPQRIFRSSQLGPGQVWHDYCVRVVLERDGREIVQERSLDLRGGESHELQFDFDNSRVASH